MLAIERKHIKPLYYIILIAMTGCTSDVHSIKDFLENDWKQFSSKKDKGKYCQKIWKYNESLFEMTITNMCEDQNFDYVQKVKVEIDNNRIISTESINGNIKTDTILMVSINDTIAVFKKMRDNNYIVFEKFKN